MVHFYLSLVVHFSMTFDNNGIQISMDSKGRATDNIAIERFWRTIKCERLYLNAYKNIKELRQDVRAYIYFYNYHRYHQTLQYKKPMEVYDYQKYLQNIKRNESVIDRDLLQKVA